MPLLMVRAPTPPMWVYAVPRPFEQMQCNISYSSGITMSSSPSNHYQAAVGQSSMSLVTSTFEIKVSSVFESKPSSVSNTSPSERKAMIWEKTAPTPEHFLEQFHELVKTALDGCKKAEALATCHQKRPCFKKIDSLCARLKQDLVKTDNVMSNINSQGLAWAVKDFIFVFTRIMNAWIIIKGYVHSKPEGLTSIQRELCPNFLDAFGRWHESTHELIQSLIKSFINLNKLAKQQRGGGHIFSKIEESKDDASAGQASNDPMDDIIEDAESSLNLSDGAYIRAGIYPNVTCPPPGFSENTPPFTGYKQQQTSVPPGDRSKTSEPKFPSVLSPVGFKRHEYRKNSAVATASTDHGSGCFASPADRNFMDHLHRKTSLECINWVLEEVRAIEEGQYFYCINFTKNYFPDFHLIRLNMIDLRAVYKKHDAGRYSMLVELLDDLQQIVDTCKWYVNASTSFGMWNPNDPIPDGCTDIQRKEMENLPKMQTFIAKMEHLFSTMQKERPMEDRGMNASPQHFSLGTITPSSGGEEIISSYCNLCNGIVAILAHFVVTRDSSVFLVSLVVLAVFISKGDAIRCFECNSAEDSTCTHSNPPDTMSVDCNDHKDGNKYTFCRKIVQIIEFPVNNLPPDNRVIRGCGWDESSYKGRCYQRSGFGGRQEVCACYDDNCNGASSLSVTFGVLLFGAVAFLIRA
uniref:Bromo domain-containing protein n=1 Tax=Anopheles christyi TaxID=43041 RepID=A0A182JQW8_9DIPT